MIENAKEIEKPICEFIEFIWKEAFENLDEEFEDDFKLWSIKQVKYFNWFILNRSN